MKVIYTINANVGGGGIGNTAYYGVKALEKYGYLEKVICRDVKGEEIPKEKVKRIPVLINKSPVYFLVNIYFDLMASLYIDEADAFYGWNGMQLYSMKKAKRKGAKLICNASSAHVLTHNRLNQEEFRRFGIKKRGIDPITVKRTLKEYELSDVIVPASEFVYQSMIKNGVSQNKLKLLPFGVDINRFKPAHKKEHNKFIAMYVGFVSVLKGVQYLLEAWDMLNLKHAELRLYGKVRHDFNRIYKKYSNRKDIKFMGHVSPIEKEYQKADIFVFPSIQEGSALVTYEAMASSLPIITTFNSGSVARDSIDGFIIPIRDPRSIAAKIQYLYDNPKERAKMGRNARKRAEKFTWEKYGERLIKVFEEVVE